MSTERRSLASYLELLISNLGAADPRSLARIRAVVGDRVARICLDAERCDVRFEDGRFVVAGAPRWPVDGTGATSTRTVLDLLGARIGVSEAILRGRLLAEGTVEDVGRMFHAIEILIETSVSAPPLQGLADELSVHPPPAEEPQPFAASMPGVVEDGELRLLRRLDLLPDA